MLDNREWVSLIWLGVVLVFVLSRRDLRSSLSSVLRSILNAVILIPLGALLAYVGLEVWVGSQLGLWSTDLAKPTVLWFLFGGLLLFANFDKAAKETDFFRRRVKAVIGGTVLLEFFINLSPMHLIMEIILQPVVAVLVGVSIVAGRSEQDKRAYPVKKLAEGALAVIGISLFAFSARQLYLNWSEIDTHALALEFLLPIWLTIGVLPFIYMLSCYATYQGIFNRIDQYTSDWRARLRAKLTLVTKFHFKTREAGAFAGYWPRQIAFAQRFGAACAVVTDYQKSRRDAERAAIREQHRLQRYAGSDGTDTEGRQLDRREFKETISVLRWLSTCQSGWYQNRGGRYRPDLLDRIRNGFPHYGLPPESGITVKVAKDGQSWYAWRRTITGWYFAIGAAGPPPGEWEYDGPEPPSDFPGRDKRWGDSPFSGDANKNWNL